MLKIPINILMMLVVFLIVAFALFTIFGAPQCDYKANQTALYLTQAINEIADSKTPYFNAANPARDIPDDPTLFRTAPITLCQQTGATSFIQAFMGGSPEYQVYFEHFPESGGGLWTEAYPWSGGASSMLVFWGALRTGIVGFKYAGKYILTGKLFATTAVLKLVKSITENSRINKVMKVFANNEELQKMINTDLKGLAKDIESRKGLVLLTTLKNKEAQTAIDAMREGKLLATKETDVLVGKDAAGRYKLILSDQLIDVKIPKINDAGEIVDYETLYVKYENGNIVDATTKAEEGFTKLQVKPTDVFKDYLDMISPEEANSLREIYGFADEFPPGLLDRLGNKVKDTNLWRKVFQPVLDAKSKFLTSIDALGYNVKIVKMPRSVRAWSAALKDIIYDQELYDKFIKPEISVKSRVADKIRLSLGLKSTEEITQLHVLQYANKVEKEMSGFMFIPKDLKYNVHTVATEFLIGDGTRTAEELASITSDDVINIVKQQLPDLYNKLGDEEVRRIIDKEVMSHIDELSKYNNPINFEEKVNLEYMKSIKDDEELGVFLGFLEQNTATLPSTYGSAIMTGSKREIKKLLFLDALSVINPSGWYAKGWASAVATQQCEGNSICVLSHEAKLETPTYLSEQADKFMVRVWRPVEPVQQYAGIQAALMHVPEHPRFYVVSPCFAVAKVWKTVYNGQDTIFVKPDKCTIASNETSGEPLASNYCYADTNLVNSYTLIWATSDLLSFLPYEKIFEAVGLPAKTITKLAGTGEEKGILNKYDPATVIQAVLEAAVSWPGYPWKQLDYQTMQQSANKCAFPQLQEEVGKTK